jgi:uncharacterized repeat protein (TIGR01451 family)
MNLGRALTAVCFLACMAPALALARPDVKVHLSGALVQKTSGGQAKGTPIQGLTLHAGDVVRYSIDATNSGDDAALDFSTVGPVPTRTQFVAGSAAAPPATIVEYSLDGKSWSTRPAIDVKTAHGVVRRAASPAKYVAIRFTAKRALAPKATFHYSYEVLVK